MMSIRRLYDEHKEVIWGRAGGYDLIPMSRDPSDLITVLYFY